MTQQMLANYAQTTLASSCTNVATTLSLVAVAGWPITGNFRLKINDVAPATTYEIVEVTSVNVGANQVTCTRGVEGTTGIAHNAGAFIGNVITAPMVPWGSAGFAEVSATQGTFTALTDLTSLTVTAFLTTGRRYRISTQVPLSSTVASDILAIGIREGATVLQGAQGQPPSTGGFLTLVASRIIVGDGASHTYKMSAERSSGTGVVTMQAGQTQVGITYYAHILLEDIGL